MPKGLFAFIAVAFISMVSLLLIYFKDSANIAHKRSEQLLKDFKTVDEDLQKNKFQADSAGNLILDSMKKTGKN